MALLGDAVALAVKAQMQPDCPKEEEANVYQPFQKMTLLLPMAGVGKLLH